jgi:hypothetical protein
LAAQQQPDNSGRRIPAASEGKTFPPRELLGFYLQKLKTQKARHKAGLSTIQSKSN